MKKSCRRDLRAFAVGAVVYPLIEIAARGRTHWSMGVVGGACLAMIGRINQRLRGKCGLMTRCAAGAMVITAMELGSGLLLNRKLRWNVWDYSDHRGNLMGQICPRYCLYWFLLNLPIQPLVLLLGY